MKLKVEIWPDVFVKAITLTTKWFTFSIMLPNWWFTWTRKEVEEYVDD